MSHKRLVPEEIKGTAMLYLCDSKTLQDAIKTRDEANAVIKEVEERLLTMRSLLEETVQPRCGSAHLPYRRVFHNGSWDRILIIQYDDQHHRGAVIVQKFDN